MAIDWKAKIEAERAALAVAQAALSAADKEEIDGRAEAAKLRADRLAAEKMKRDLDLARRIDLARETLGEKAQIAAMDADFDGMTHTFIILHKGPDAFAKWERLLAASISTGKTPNGTKVDRAEITREYALASIYDWNGATDLHGMTSESGMALLDLVKNNPGLATSIAGVAAKLAGYALEERKS